VSFFILCELRIKESSVHRFYIIEDREVCTEYREYLHVWINMKGR